MSSSLYDYSLLIIFLPYHLPLATFPHIFSCQTSRESLSSADVSEVGLSSHQGALGAPVVPQPSGSPAAAAATPAPTTSKVGHWQLQQQPVLVSAELKK